MAYREFHVEKIYDAPDVGILDRGLNKAADNIGALFRSISEQQIAKRKAADQYKYDLGNRKFESDDKIMKERVYNLAQRGKQDMKVYGRLSQETEHDQHLAEIDKDQSDWQYKKFEDNELQIATREKEDKYFDPEPDRQANRLAAYGENNDIYYATRGERLETYEKVKGKLPQSLRGKMYTSDYVKMFGQKEKTKVTGDPTYKSTTYDKTPFLTPQGTPGITVDHAKEYLGSRPDGSVARWIEGLVDQDMDRDVAYNKERNEKLKGMSDEEIKLYLKANPSENKLTSKDYATRVIEKAQGEMMEAADIARKTDYERKSDDSVTGGLYKNDAVGHSYTEHRDAPISNPDKQYYPGGVKFPDQVPEPVMPGGNLLIGKGAKIGQPIPVTLNPRKSYNIRTGENSDVRGSTDVNLTGYQLQLYDNKGNVIAANYRDVDKLSQAQLKDAQLKIALRGFTVENGNKLGEISSKKSQLDDELADAIASGDTEKQALVERNIMNLERLKANMNLSKGEFSDADLLSAFKQNGISVNSVRRDVILEASDADLNIIDRNLTQGLNLKDKSKWSPQMIEFEAKVQRMKNAPEPVKTEETKPTPIKKAKVRTITYNGEDIEVPPGRLLARKPNGEVITVSEAQRKLAESKGYTIIE